MTIMELLKKENVRISHGNRWLYYNEADKLWEVREQEYRKHNSTLIISTIVEESAVRRLLNNE